MGISIGASSSEDSLSVEVYDPQDIQADAFDRDNHTGTQDQDTIVDLEDDLTGTYHPSTLVMYYGLEEDLLTGWQLADGTNGTPDMSGFFPRGASSDDEVGTTVDYTTALPVTDFTTESKSVTPSGSVAVATAYPINGSTTSKIPYGTSNWEGDGGSDIEGSGDIYPKQDNTSSISSDNLAHSHTATFTGDTLSVGGQTVSGGDSETAPTHIFVYWIAYTGSLAGNWV